MTASRPAPLPRTSTARRLSTGVVIAFGLAALALPAISAATALAAGVAIAVTLGNPLPYATHRAARLLLPASVVALGGAMDLAVVARVGVRGVGYTVATLTLCGTFGAALAAAMRVRPRIALLVTLGTAICGGSAIGFVAVAALATWWPALRPAGHVAAWLGARALVLTLFLVGLGLSRASLRAVGPRPLALGVSLWLAVAGTTLAAVKTGLLHP